MTDEVRSARYFKRVSRWWRPGERPVPLALRACAPVSSVVIHPLMGLFWVTPFRSSSVVLLSLSALLACSRSRSADIAISMRGSDTLVQVATAWAETYARKVPGVSVTASGGGSGTGIAGLIDGTVDVATSSREMKAQEKQAIRARRGDDVTEHVIGYDALALYVNRANPVTSISLPTLQEIWSEGGSITRWSQITSQLDGPIVLVGRQNSSGTYDYFREIVCGETERGVHREFRNGISELNGSSEVIEKVAGARLALGYTGMGYRNDRVRWLAVARTDDGPAIEPSIDSARSGAYPIARKLYLYTVGSLSPELRAFIDWTLSPEGQRLVAQEGYVPVS